VAVDALRELEFDRETGKISESDYGPLKARYTEQALAVMRAGSAPVCEKCGPRPESDAEFCSNCGSALIS
jgi:ribosomal protein L40E